MIDPQTLRPTEYRQLRPQENPDDRNYLEQVHHFIDEEYDQLLSEIGDKESRGELGKDWVDHVRKEAHKLLEARFTGGEAYWPAGSEVFDSYVVGTVKAADMYRRDWGIEVQPREIKKELGRSEREQIQDYQARVDYNRHMDLR